MKKMRKIFAVLLTLAMVLAMSIPTFAAQPNTATITVDKLTPNDNTTVSIYQVVKFNDAQSKWEVSDWVGEALKKDSTLVNLEVEPAVINYEELYKKYLPTTPTATKTKINDSSVDFTGLEVGAYLITASGNTTSYTVMGAATYDYGENNNLIKPIDAKVNAKGEKYTVVKSLVNTNQAFVMKGDTVEFNIDTVFPSYDPKNINRTFTIKDKPTGMKITAVEVTVGGTPVGAENYTVTGLNEKNTEVTVAFKDTYIVKSLVNTNQAFVMKGDTVEFNIDTVFPSYDPKNINRTFTIKDKPTGMKITAVEVTVGGTPVGAENYTVTGLNEKNTEVTVAFKDTYIGKSNEHAAQAVRVKVTAVVTSDDGSYKNEATSNYDSDPSEVIGRSGSLTIYKTTNEEKVEDRNPLTGAKFSIVKTVDGEADKSLEFVELEAGKYTLYTEDTEIPEGKTKVTEVTVGADGKVLLKGLGAGTYKITETLAPEGYSINNNIPNARISAGENNENIEINVPDSKLSALPSTGGIGTTIFTIAGCLIMVTAAGLFFASRKRTNK